MREMHCPYQVLQYQDAAISNNKHAQPWVQDPDVSIKAEVTSSGLGIDPQLASSSGASQSQMDATMSDPADANITGVSWTMLCLALIHSDARSCLPTAAQCIITGRLTQHGTCNTHFAPIPCNQHLAPVWHCT